MSTGSDGYRTVETRDFKKAGAMKFSDWTCRKGRNRKSLLGVWLG